jgi:hypothetical protein
MLCYVMLWSLQAAVSDAANVGSSLSWRTDPGTASQVPPVPSDMSYRIQYRWRCDDRRERLSSHMNEKQICQDAQDQTRSLVLPACTRLKCSAQRGRGAGVEPNGGRGDRATRSPQAQPHLPPATPPTNCTALLQKANNAAPHPGLNRHRTDAPLLRPDIR